jgi:hypothetical protein
MFFYVQKLKDFLGYQEDRKRIETKKPNIKHVDTRLITLNSNLKTLIQNNLKNVCKFKNL